MNIISNTNPLSDPEVSYECRKCPKCNSTNWAPGRHPYQTFGYNETDAIQCWKCRAMFKIDCYSPGVITKAQAINEDMIVCIGVPDPSIPLEVLRNLVDAAQDKAEDLKWQIRAAEEDPDLVKMVQDIVDAVDYVKCLISDT